MSHLKAVKFAGLVSSLVAFVCPKISKIENANMLFSHKSGKLFTKYNTLVWPQKCYTVILLKHSFILLLLAPFSTPSQILNNMERAKMDPKNRKFKNLRTTRKFYIIWVEEILLMVLVWVKGGLGSRLKFQGVDSYPVNKCRTL